MPLPNSNRTNICLEISYGISNFCIVYPFWVESFSRAFELRRSGYLGKKSTIIFVIELKYRWTKHLSVIVFTWFELFGEKCEEKKKRHKKSKNDNISV